MIDADSVDPIAGIDGAAVLDDAHAALTRYVVFPDEYAPVATTLWVAATHGISAWQHATRLAITSPQKRCGKSRLLDVIAGLSHSPLLCVNTTTAAVYRSIGDGADAPTLMIDEADALFGTKRAAEQNEDLRALLNAGFQHDRPARRCVGPQQIPTDFNTFAMAALAAIGRLPDTITDRAISIGLKRRGAGERVSQFRMRRDGAQLATLRERLAAWVQERIGELASAEPDMPVEDRFADAWEPLIAIADAAGSDWPRRARAACKALTDSAVDDDDELGTVLLSDIRRIFADVCQPFIPSNALVRELRDIEESPWGRDDIELTASKLAKRLRPYGVKPGHNAAKTIRGYALDTLADAFRRYLRPDPSERPKQTQHESADGEKASGRPQPVRGRLQDVRAENRESAESAGQTAVLDGWTGTDGTPDGNGSAPRQCPCGRPAPVDPETGLCQWCTLAASKQVESR